jgi:hypothetical protein
MKKLQQASVLARRTKKFEPDPPGTDRTDHGRRLEGRPILVDEELQIEDIVHFDLRLAFNHAASQRQISDGSLFSDLAPGEREGETDRDAPMLAPVYQILGVAPGPSKGQEATPAALAPEGGDPQQTGQALKGRQTRGPEYGVFPALGTRKWERHG